MLKAKRIGILSKEEHKTLCRAELLLDPKRGIPQDVLRDVKQQCETELITIKSMIYYYREILQRRREAALQEDSDK
jgi:hypothetical protein